MDLKGTTLSENSRPLKATNCLVTCIQSPGDRRSWRRLRGWVGGRGREEGGWGCRGVAAASLSWEPDPSGPGGHRRLLTGTGQSCAQTNARASGPEPVLILSGCDSRCYPRGNRDAPRCLVSLSEPGISAGESVPVLSDDVRQ